MRHNDDIVGGMWVLTFAVHSTMQENCYPMMWPSNLFIFSFFVCLLFSLTKCQVFGCCFHASVFYFSISFNSSLCFLQIFVFVRANIICWILFILSVVQMNIQCYCCCCCYCSIFCITSYNINQMCPANNRYSTNTKEKIKTDVVSHFVTIT